VIGAALGARLAPARGFLVGGGYTTWKTARTMAIVLLVAAGLAAGGAIAWYVA
jgi:hypothetical protein